MPVSSSELHAGSSEKNRSCLFPVPNSTRAGPEKMGHACFQFRTLRGHQLKIGWCLVPRPKKSRKIRLSAMIRLGPGWVSLFSGEALTGLGRKGPSRGDDPSQTMVDFFILRRGAHRVGGGKTRLSVMIRLGPGYIFILRRGAHRVGGGKIRLSTMIRLGPGYIFILR